MTDIQNNGPIVRYSGHSFNNEVKFPYSGHGLNYRPVKIRFQIPLYLQNFYTQLVHRESAYRWKNNGSENPQPEFTRFSPQWNAHHNLRF